MNNLILSSLANSIDRLIEILQQEVTVANRDSAIKRFELTYELAWKSLKNYLYDQGVIAKTPREAFSEAFKLGLIQDEPIWLEMIKIHSLTVHTYGESTAIDVYQNLSSYLVKYQELYLVLKNKVS
jgi:nucleotidyltransferase substrate binding protein (TIGR01987 family)